MSTQTVAEKTCTRCKRQKPFGEFYPMKVRGNATLKSHFRATCKRCNTEVRQAEYRAKAMRRMTRAELLAKLESILAHAVEVAEFLAPKETT